MAKLTNSDQSQSPVRSANQRLKQTRTPGYTTGGVMCLGGVSILCRTVTHAMGPTSSSGKLQDQCIKNSLTIGMKPVRIRVSEDPG
jgi:hypothetical protein